jgi:hypothetical protein
MMPAESCFVELDVKKPRPDVLRDDSYFQYQLRRERESGHLLLPCLVVDCTLSSCRSVKHSQSAHSFVSSYTTPKWLTTP